MFVSFSSSISGNKLVKLMIICLMICFIAPGSLFSYEYGGFTDPQTPGRHSKLKIDSANIVVKPHGIYAEVSTEFWYRPIDLTSSYDTLEMYAFFTLPATDFFNDSWLWVEDTLVRAMIIDVEMASLIYEDIVHRQHRDPSILYRRNTYGQYEYRIFPNVGDQSRHAKYSYYTKMNYINGVAQFTYSPCILNIANNKNIPRNFKFYLNSNFTDIEFGDDTPETNYSSDSKGDFVEFHTSDYTLKQVFSYQYDFSEPYFSKSDAVDGQEYYFTMFDSKLLTSNYIKQKINFLIDYDVNRTSFTPEVLIDQLKKAILANFSSGDSINIMIGGKETINLFNRWVPCDKDTINLLLDSTVSEQIGYYSYLADLLVDGVNFNKQFDDNSSIILLTGSEYAPTPTTANPIIESCLDMMLAQTYKITSIDFSDTHYSTYYINSKAYYGGQYFNENIAELTRGDYFTLKGSSSNVYSLLNSAVSLLKGSITDIGLYVEPEDGISIAKTTEDIIDKNSNSKLIYEYGKLVGSYPIEVKFSGLLDGIPVIQDYEINDSNVVINNESAKMWNWEYIRELEDKSNKTKKETDELTDRSMSNRILSMQTAFLCLEPWMMNPALVGDEDDDGDATSVHAIAADPGLEITYGPNPVRDYLSIKINLANEYANILYVRIYDLMGNVIKEIPVNTFSDTINLSWDLSSNTQSRVPPGIYYLVVKTNTGVKTLKLCVV